MVPASVRLGTGTGDDGDHGCMTRGALVAQRRRYGHRSGDGAVSRRRRRLEED